MADGRSPIERMIDKACGVPDGWVAVRNPGRILLRCPACNKSAAVARAEDDPPRAVVALLSCPTCTSPDADAVEIEYRDANGNEVFA